MSIIKVTESNRRMKVKDNKTDKRKHERIKTHIPVKYHKLRDGSGFEGATSISKNLSKGGIRFRTSDFVSMACRLILELDIPVFNKPIKAISRVAWIKKAASGDDYEVGNQFLEMSKKDQELISEYVDEINMYDNPEEALSQIKVVAKVESDIPETKEPTG